MPVGGGSSRVTLWVTVQTVLVVIVVTKGSTATDSVKRRAAGLGMVTYPS